MKKTLLLIDANSLIHRAFHALPPLSTSRGEMTNAVYGFVSILLRAIKELNPEYIAAAFDMEGPTFRHRQFKEYKATRAQAPDELYSQFPLIKEVLGAFHIPVYERKGFEADDVIGTIAKQVSEGQKQEAVETIIVSGDMDTLQLVEANTKVYTMKKGIQDSVIYDTEGVQKKFEGLGPSQMRDYKGLRGDPSDNIPGVSGVGEKTAIQLLKEFGSIERLYKQLKSRKASSIKPSLKEKLLKGERDALQSKELATIKQDVSIHFSLQDLAWRQYNRQEVEDLLVRLEFESLVKRMPGSGEGTAPKTQDAMFVGETAGNGEKEKALGKIERLYHEGVLSEQLYGLEKKLVPVIEGMQEVGIKIDKPYFKKLTHEMDVKIGKLRQNIYGLARKEFNVNSTQQLSVVLFEPPPDGLGLSPKGLKKTPKGVVSTASPELEKLEGEHAIIKDVLLYRELQKLYTTYGKPLPDMADEEGRLHTHFDQLGAATGRLSSSNPNLQNIPNQGEWGLLIRKGFVAEQGWKLVSFDYSQMELRIAAHITRDPRLVSFFQQGADIHRMTAATVFGVAPEHVTQEMRFRAKALNFGVLYGMGAQGFARTAGISVEEARNFIENYFAQFPRIQEYMEEAKAFVRQHRYAETFMGRKRFLPEINSTAPQLRAAAERMAINHPIQGALADIIKMAMVEIDEAVAGKREGWRMLLQIHDELLFEMKDGIISETAEVIGNIMEKTGRLGVPVVVEVKQGERWGEMQKLTR